MSSGFDWPGLLKWSMNYTDGTNDSDKLPLSEEKKAFLEKVCKEYMKYIKDYHKAIQEALDMVSLDDVDKTMGALQLIRDIIHENPEIARNFDKIGAAQKLVACLDFTSDYANPVVLSCLAILSDVAQNNPALQNALVELNSIRKLCVILKDSSEAIIRVKGELKTIGDEDPKAIEQLNLLITSHTLKRLHAMRCVSNIIRHNKKAEETFSKQGGLTWIKYALQQKDAKFMQSATLLLYHLLAEGIIDATTIVKADRTSKNSKSTIFTVLMRKMVAEDEGAPGMDELFIQTVAAMWSNGGTRMSDDNIKIIIDSVKQKIVILEGKPDTEKEYYDIELKNLQDLLKTIKADSSV